MELGGGGGVVWDVVWFIRGRGEEQRGLANFQNNGLSNCQAKKFDGRVEGGEEEGEVEARNVFNIIWFERREESRIDEQVLRQELGSETLLPVRLLVMGCE